MIHDIMGWVGAFLFATCGVPQAIKVWKTKKAEDISWWFLIFWLLGEILTLGYIIIDDIALKITHFPLYLNYAFNIIIVLYLLLAKKIYK